MYGGDLRRGSRRGFAKGRTEGIYEGAHGGDLRRGFTKGLTEGIYEGLYHRVRRGTFGTHHLNINLNMYRYILRLRVPARASGRDPILGGIPGIDFLRSLTATKVGNPEDIVFGENATDFWVRGGGGPKRSGGRVRIEEEGGGKRREPRGWPLQSRGGPREGSQEGRRRTGRGNYY